MLTKILRGSFIPDIIIEPIKIDDLWAREELDEEWKMMRRANLVFV